MVQRVFVRRRSYFGLHVDLETINSWQRNSLALAAALSLSSTHLIGRCAISCMEICLQSAIIDHRALSYHEHSSKESRTLTMLLIVYTRLR